MKAVLNILKWAWKNKWLLSLAYEGINFIRKAVKKGDKNQPVPGTKVPEQSAQEVKAAEENSASVTPKVKTTRKGNK